MSILSSVLVDFYHDSAYASTFTSHKVTNFSIGDIFRRSIATRPHSHIRNGKSYLGTGLCYISIEFPILLREFHPQTAPVPYDVEIVFSHKFVVFVQ